MFHVILFEPEIPPNTGNAIRLCANTGATLHLVRPLGFRLDDARVKRAGLDYHEMSRVREHGSLEACLAALGDARVFAVETTGSQRHDAVRYRAGDAFLFGRETAGLPPEMLDSWPRERLIRLPMVPGNRSLNLSNAVAVVVFEAWRQLGFPGSS
jgi:tRNA (cytidine/uridine-2'-O-)-methyltransferase